MTITFTVTKEDTISKARNEYAKTYFSTGMAMNNVVKGCDAAILRLPSTVAQRISNQVIKAGIPFATEIVFDASDGAQSANSFFEKMLWRIIDC